MCICEYVLINTQISIYVYIQILLLFHDSIVLNPKNFISVYDGEYAIIHLFPIVSACFIYIHISKYANMRISKYMYI